MSRLLLLAAALAPFLLSLSGCGKYGPNTPPGPPDKIIYYRLQYPSQ
jgi:predicted small lipoprotein YifL